MSGVTLAILVFLGISLLFYVLFGGADFGAGILELFLGPKDQESQRKVISKAMAPVWEANHVWLILAVVIIFMGFPRLYTLISIHLHLPLLAVLVGIVARGCAFTFRHYDTLDRSFYGVYSKVFSLSSLWTSFFLGVTAGAVLLGRIQLEGETFAVLYLAPWLNEFSFSVGVFSSCLFAFLASVYLVGETQDQKLKAIFIKKSAFSNLAVIASGILVFVAARSDDLPLTQMFLSSGVSVVSFVGASLLWTPFWKALQRDDILLSRILGASIVAAVLIGWFALQFPIVLGMNIFEIAAPDATQRALLGALVVGSLLIFPALFYLLRVFKGSEA